MPPPLHPTPELDMMGLKNLLLVYLWQATSVTWSCLAVVGSVSLSLAWDLFSQMVDSNFTRKIETVTRLCTPVLKVFSQGMFFVASKMFSVSLSLLVPELKLLWWTAYLTITTGVSKCCQILVKNASIWPVTITWDLLKTTVTVPFKVSPKYVCTYFEF